MGVPMRWKKAACRQGLSEFRRHEDYESTDMLAQTRWHFKNLQSQTRCTQDKPKNLPVSQLLPSIATEERFRRLFSCPESIALNLNFKV